jgi:hypothetical protein
MVKLYYIFNNYCYKIDDFCIPYIVKKDDLDILLKKNDAIDKPPEHMYS